MKNLTRGRLDGAVPGGGERSGDVRQRAGAARRPQGLSGVTGHRGDRRQGGRKAWVG